ncbi:MAG: FecR family protein [Rhodospirillaceae bacterium]
MKSGASEDFPASASAWALRLSEADLPAPERRAFAQWLAGGGGRLREVKQALAVLRISGALRDSEIAHTHLDQSLRVFRDGAYSETAPSFPRRRAIAAGAAALAAGGLFAAVLRPRSTSGTPILGNDAKVATAVGDIERFNLSDHSSLTVGASSAVQMAFTDARREISVYKGKAFFEVAHNAERPFTVKAGSHQVVVTGTKFNVSYNQAKDQLEVAVIEGAVNVGAAHGASTTAPERLTMGAVTLFPTGYPATSRKLTPDQASAWRTGLLYFDEADLDDLLLDLNGYLPKPLVLTGAHLSRLTLTAQLPAGDAQAAIFVLLEVLGIEAVEFPDRWELSQTGQ